MSFLSPNQQCHVNDAIIIIIIIIIVTGRMPADLKTCQIMSFTDTYIIIIIIKVLNDTKWCAFKSAGILSISRQVGKRLDSLTLIQFSIF